MVQKFVISPSILSANFATLGDSLSALKKAGIEKIHLDVMDGHFVPNISFGLPVIKSLIDQFDFKWDAHLMVSNPDESIPSFAKAGVNHMTIHAEACTNLDSTVQLIKDHGMTAGVALKPETPLTVLDLILEELDLVLIMTVNPGFGGQSFMASQLSKITELKMKIEKLDQEIVIQVDGGINHETYKKVIEAGGHDLVIGSALLKHANDQYQTYINSFYAD